jgi:hypothetical protein
MLPPTFALEMAAMAWTILCSVVASVIPQTSLGRRVPALFDLMLCRIRMESRGINRVECSTIDDEYLFLKPVFGTAAYARYRTDAYATNP